MGSSSGSKSFSRTGIFICVLIGVVAESSSVCHCTCASNERLAKDGTTGVKLGVSQDTCECIQANQVYSRA